MEYIFRINLNIVEYKVFWLDILLSIYIFGINLNIVEYKDW